MSHFRWSRFHGIPPACRRGSHRLSRNARKPVALLGCATHRVRAVAMEQQRGPVVVLWDIEQCHIPASLTGLAVVSILRDFALAQVLVVGAGAYRSRASRGVTYAE
jgi:hypothetical protein